MMKSSIVRLPGIHYDNICSVKHEVRLVQVSRSHCTSSHGDSFSFAWGPLSLMKHISGFDGCTLNIESCHTSQRIVVKLRLSDDQANLDRSDDDDDEQVLYINPVQAANLGIAWDEDHLEARFKGLISIHHNTLFPAKVIRLRPLGRPYDDSRLRPHAVSDFSEWPLPSRGSLIQLGALMPVHDKTTERVYYYEVLNIDNSNFSSDSDDQIVMMVDDATQFELDSSPLGLTTRRLPPLLSVNCFVRSLSGSHDAAIPHHPSASSVRAALMAASAPQSHLSGIRLQNVIGNERDHGLLHCIETSSRESGLECISIRGLAAFAGQSSHRVTSGSVQDQLAGLAAVMKMIHVNRHMPCVLHLYDFDEELNIHEDDVRIELEKRLLSIISSHGVVAYQSLRDSTTGTGPELHTVPLTVVLATTNKLQNGPLLRRCDALPIQMMLPDAKYVDYLSESCSSFDADMLSLLVGRPKDDILWLLKHLDMDSKKTQSACSLLHLRDLCSGLDERKRGESSSFAVVKNVRWGDIGGAKHVREVILDSIVLPLKHPELFQRGSPRVGILLYGPPGSGKTLVAKAVASECGLPFLSVKGPELLGSYVGESEANVRAVFLAARRAAWSSGPRSAAILFFDELDSLVPRRGATGDGGGLMERVVATMFAEIDNARTVESGRKSTIFVLGATNRPDLLDPGLLRPGRLDKLVYLGPQTTIAAKTQVLEVQLKGCSLDGSCSDMALEIASLLDHRMTGADMQKIASDAALRAVSRMCASVDRDIQEKALKTGQELSVDAVLRRWKPEDRVPKVTIDDLKEAAAMVRPSVTEDETARYERLREYFDSR